MKRQKEKKRIHEKNKRPVGQTIPYMSMTGKCLKDNAARFNKDKSNLHLITVRDLNKVEDIIESKESQ